MNKLFIPTYHAKNIFEVDINFFLKKNIKYLLLDLDNTLDSYKIDKPSQKTIDLINNFKSHNLIPIIISNNTSSRVLNYASSLNIKYFSGVNKPFKKKLLKILSKENINKDDCIIIGDQIITDIICGNKAKIKTMLLEKLVKEDPLPTRINRLFDKCIRSSLIKHNLMKDYKEAL